MDRRGGRARGERQPSQATSGSVYTPRSWPQNLVTNVHLVMMYISDMWGRMLCGVTLEAEDGTRFGDDMKWVGIQLDPKIVP